MDVYSNFVIFFQGKDISFHITADCESQCIMTQPGAGARAKRFKCNSFSRTVTLIKTNDEHTSFSDMRNLKTKSVIEFSSSMTQDNVRDKIQETFPYLENKR